MSRGRQIFKQTDLTRAIKATEKAGYKPLRATVRTNGEILVEFAQIDTTVEQINEWDTV
jgi:hypothetical protein